MIESLVYNGQKASYNQYQVTINGIKMIVRDNVIYSDFGRTGFTGAAEFLRILTYEGILTNGSKDEILLRYNFLINKNSFIAK
jgi:hypothetical protein